jgi:hypothetical protein
MQRTCENCGRQNPANWGVCGSCARPFPARPQVAPVLAITADKMADSFAAADAVVRRWGHKVVGALAVVAAIVLLPDWSGERATEREAERVRVAASKAAAVAAARADAAAQAKKLADAERAIVETLIVDKRAWVGMTREQAVRSWGVPSHTNNTTTAAGTSEQWVYDTYNHRNKYLYLSNGIVTSVQTSQ